MKSILVLRKADALQKEMIAIVKALKDFNGVYVSLNKAHESIKGILKENRVSSDSIFFIDAVDSTSSATDALHISPRKLDLISYSIKSFINELPDKKFVLIDALSTLLIYNSENAVAAFLRELLEFLKDKEVQIIALTPITKGEDLLAKIYGFFDKVEKKR